MQQNKHVKAVTRDRASAYASAIEEALPDAMQIADRFHLHQNLLEVIQESLNSLIPASIKIPKDIGEIGAPAMETESSDESSKKNAMRCGKLSGI